MKKQVERLLFIGIGGLIAIISFSIINIEKDTADAQKKRPIIGIEKDTTRWVETELNTKTALHVFDLLRQNGVSEQDAITHIVGAIHKRHEITERIYEKVYLKGIRGWGIPRPEPVRIMNYHGNFYGRKNTHENDTRD